MTRGTPLGSAWARAGLRVVNGIRNLSGGLAGRTHDQPVRPARTCARRRSAPPRAVSGGSRTQPPRPTTRAPSRRRAGPRPRARRASRTLRSATSAVAGSCETTIAVVACARVKLGDQRPHRLRADGVQFAGRLVGQQQLRPVRERRAQRDPLALAARELLRERAPARSPQPGRFQQLSDPTRCCTRRACPGAPAAARLRRQPSDRATTTASGALAEEADRCRGAAVRERVRAAGRCRCRARGPRRRTASAAPRSRAAACSCRRRSDRARTAARRARHDSVVPWSAAASPSLVRWTQNTSLQLHDRRARAPLPTPRRFGARPLSRHALPPTSARVAIHPAAASAASAARPHRRAEPTARRSRAAGAGTATVPARTDGRDGQPCQHDAAAPRPTTTPSTAASSRRSRSSRARRADRRPGRSGRARCARRARRRAARRAVRAPRAHPPARWRRSSVPSTARATGAERNWCSASSRNDTES